MKILSLKNSIGLDHAGIVASSICVAHCTIAPLLIAAVPLLGLKFLIDETTEWMLVGVSLAIGPLSLIPGCVKRHRKWRPLVLFGTGALLLLVTRLYLEEQLEFEIPLLLAAAVLITASHLTNLRLCRSCSICADDRE